MSPEPAARRRPDPPPRSLVIGCGALARELVALTRRPGFEHVDLTCLPADLHNRPGGIPAAVRRKIQRRAADATNGSSSPTPTAAPAACSTRCSRRRASSACPAPTATSSTPAGRPSPSSPTRSPATFFLTDFLARNFERLVIRGLGLDRHPELLPVYFGNYRRVVYLAQTDDPALVAAAARPPRRLGLAFELRPTGYGDLAGHRALAGRWPTSRPARRPPVATWPPDGRTLTVIWWRDIPAQVVAKDGRQAAKIVLHPRFQVAIDKAAVKAGRRKAMDDYIAEWRKTQAPCGDEPDGERRQGRGRAASSTTYTARRSWPASIGRRRPRTRPAPTPAPAGMTRTVIGSATREVVIGADQPFVIIGERINPTGRKLLAEEMKAGDFSRVERDVLAQVEAGAHMLDVNAGIPLADEPAILARTIQLVQSPDRPARCRSTRRSSRRSRPAWPSTRARPWSTRSPARTSGSSGSCRWSASTARRSSPSPTTRPASRRTPTSGSRSPKRIVERAADHGIPREDVIVDPLLMPIGALRHAGRQVFRDPRPAARRAARQHTCGASNVSFGLPNREGINGAFLAMAIASGLTSAITNPLLAEVRQAVMAADVLMGNDPECGRWIRDYRAPPAEGEQGRRVNRRRDAVAAPAPAERRGDALDRPAAAMPDRCRSSSSRRPAGAAGSPTGTTVLDAARSLGVDIDSVCGGRGICGRCQVEPGDRRVPQARHRPRAATTSRAPGALEAAYRGRARAGRRTGA